MSDSDDDIDEQLTQARALLQSGNKVFLQHNHKPGYLNEKAPWNGEYHLAHVQESYNPTTNSCKVLWKRDGNGYGVTMSYTLDSPTQVKSAFDYANMVVLIEDDLNGQSFSGKIADLLDGNGSSGSNRPGEVQIKWDTGQKKLVCVSQVQITLNSSRRKRRRVMVSSSSNNMGTTAQLKKSNGNTGKKKEQEIIIIDSSSSSPSSEEDEENGHNVQNDKEDDDKKQPWVDDVPASSLSWGCNKVAAAKSNTGSSVMRVTDRGMDPPKFIDTSALVSTSTRKLFSNDFSRTSSPTLSNATPPRIMQGGDTREKRPSSPAEYSSSDGSYGMARGNSFDTQEGVYDESSDAKPAATQRNNERMAKPATTAKSTAAWLKRGSSSSSDASQPSSSDDDSVEDVTPPNMAAAQKSSTSNSSLRSSDEESDADKMSNKVARKRLARKCTAAAPLPRKNTRAPQAVKQQLSTKKNSLLLHGFVQSLPEMKKDPHKALGVVKEVIENALECNKNSEEFKEAVIDANMLLQESLYHLSEHTHFITAPRTKEVAKLHHEEGENKERIVSLAKQVGLMDEHIDDVFKHIGIDTIEKDGETTNYYSIDKAVPIIMDMEKKCSSLDDATSQDMSTNFAANPNTTAATAEAERKRLELLGLRVRSVFEDGCEYEGTISDVHYRVRYDDHDTEGTISDYIIECL